MCKQGMHTKYQSYYDLRVKPKTFKELIGYNLNSFAVRI